MKLAPLFAAALSAALVLPTPALAAEPAKAKAESASTAKSPAKSKTTAAAASKPGKKTVSPSQFTLVGGC